MRRFIDGLAERAAFTSPVSNGMCGRLPDCRDSSMCAVAPISSCLASPLQLPGAWSRLMDVRSCDGDIEHLARSGTSGWHEAHAQIVPAALTRLHAEEFRERLQAALPEIRVGQACPIARQCFTSSGATNSIDYSSPRRHVVPVMPSH